MQVMKLVEYKHLLVSLKSLNKIEVFKIARMYCQIRKTEWYVKKEISYCLKSRKQICYKDIHEEPTFVNLIPQQSSKCKTCNARKPVFAKKEGKPYKKKKWFSQIIKHANLLFRVQKTY